MEFTVTITGPKKRDYLRKLFSFWNWKLLKSRIRITYLVYFYTSNTSIFYFDSSGPKQNIQMTSYVLLDLC